MPTLSKTAKSRINASRERERAGIPGQHPLRNRRGSLTGGPQTHGALRKTLLAILLLAASLGAQTAVDPDSVWLYTQPNYAGSARQIRRSTGDLGGKVTYRSLRVGAKVYAELFGAKRHRGPRTVAYDAIEDLAAVDPPLAPRSLRLGRKAEIELRPVIDPESGETRRVIGVMARVSLDRLQVGLASEHQQCSTPCVDGGCPPAGGFFFDPVRPVYDPKNPQRSWFGRAPMQLMINTSYFRICAQSKYHLVKCANGSGLTIAEGRKLLDQTVPDDFGFLLDAIVFSKGGGVEMYRNQQIPSDLSNAELAISGNWFFTGDDYSCAPCHDPDQRRSRTVLGLDQANRTLTIVVIQGGRSSEGMTARQVQAFLRQQGAWRGLMLDGGGSSQFVAVGKDGQPLWTVPPGDQEGYRPVPSAFGIVGLRAK